MWCYQKPGFEALLLAELQKQQQCSRFCDTLLEAEGVSVPVHSCVLSAISPHISSALSSPPAPPAGQRRLLEFGALGARTLLHVVGLLYSGEMAGEGEREKQEAVSAAAQLGIHGLVEVTERDRKGRNEEGGGRHTEAGVQTEPLVLEEREGRWCRWRREVRDGSTFLWKETLSEGGKDMWTQTEELQVNEAPPPHSAASFETIDMAALQGLGQTDSHLAVPQIPYVPISLVYTPEENQAPQPSSASLQDPTAAGCTPFAVVAPPYTPVPPSLLPFPAQTALGAGDPQSWWTGPRGAAGDDVEGEEWGNERLEQFQGNIPGFINYFLNPEKEEGSRRGRARRRQGARVGGARRAGTGERRARRPRARSGGRCRGGLTQTVDVQEVTVSRQQKLFLQRWGTRTSTTGQGGGAAGRKLYLKTRELLKSTKSCQRRRRRRGQAWDFNQSGDMLPPNEGGGGGGGGGSTRRGRRSATQQFKQDGFPVDRASSARAKAEASVSFSSTPMRFSNIHPLSSPSPYLPSPAASSLLHTTSLPPPAPPPHEDQPEHLDRLLEEVMMGLDILPIRSNGAPHSQPPLGCTSGLLGAGPGAMTRGANGRASANGEVPVLQQQGEGELNEMLDRFLQSFEQHMNNSSSREEGEMDGESSTDASKLYTVLNRYIKTVPRPVIRSETAEPQQSDKAETPSSRSQPRGPGKVKEGAGKRLNKRRKSQYLFSLEKKRVRVRKPESASDAKTKTLHDRGDRQLQQMPVVKLERSCSLPERVKLQGHGCQNLEVKSPAQMKSSSSSVKHPHGTSSEKTQPVSWSTKTYPIRSRLREARVMDSRPFPLPLVDKPPPSEGQPGRRRGLPKRNGQLLSLSNGGGSVSPVHLQPVEPSEQQGKDRERHEDELTVRPQEEAEGPARRGQKRGAGEETGDDAAAAKRVRSEQMAQPTSDSRTPSSESADLVSGRAAAETEDLIDVDTSAEERAEETVRRQSKLTETEEGSMDEEMEGSGDEIIDVDGDAGGSTGLKEQAEEERRRSRTAPAPSPSAEELSARSAGSWEDEDVDVIGGSSPVPDPVIISWTESSEGEEEDGDEDIDVVGEKTDCASLATFAAVSKSELVDRKYQTELIFH